MVIPAAMTAQTAKTRQWKGAPFKLSTTTAIGDVNGDGDVNVTDVTLLVGHILGNENSNFIIENADVNGDGDITVTDVTKLVGTILEGNGGNGSGIGDTSQAYLTCPNDHHPHMIDLGLPSGTLWACCNVGASNPEEHGKYYAYGEIEDKENYTDVTYIYSSGVDTYGEGWYNPSYPIDLLDLGSNIAGTKYDVAHVKWGGKWQIPTIDQLMELADHSNFNCRVTWSEDREGAWIISNRNEGKIYLPAAGMKQVTYTYYEGCLYRSGTPEYKNSPSGPDIPCLRFTYDDSYPKFGYWNYKRPQGFPVRPVWIP